MARCKLEAGQGAQERRQAHGAALPPGRVAGVGERECPREERLSLVQLARLTQGPRLLHHPHRLIRRRLGCAPAFAKG